MDGLESTQPVCVASGDPIEVLYNMKAVYSVVDGDNYVARDAAVIFVLALLFKVLHIVGVMYKTSRVAAIN